MNFSTSGYFCLLILSLIGFSAAIENPIVPGCPVFSAQPNLEFSLFDGKWYIHHMMRNVDEVTISCFNVEWTFQEISNTTARLDEKVELISTPGGPVDEEIHVAFVNNTLRKGKIFNYFEQDAYDVNIVFTDYENIMWTQCSNQGGQIYYQIFLASRYFEQPFPEKLMNQLTVLLEMDYGVDVSRFTPIFQEKSCPNNIPSHLSGSSTLQLTTSFFIISVLLSLLSF